MMSAPPSDRQETSGPVRRFRTRHIVLAAMIGAGLTASIAVPMWRHVPIPDPPVVDVSEMEPAIVESIERARQRILESRRSADAWGHLGMVLHAHDVTAEAAACYAQAESLDTREPRWPYLHGLMLARHNSDLNDCVARLRSAAKLGGVGAVPRLVLGEFLVWQGELDEAQAWFRMVIDSDARNPRANLGLGRVAYERGRLDESLKHLYTSADVQPNARPTHALLAEVYFRMGDKETAEQELRTAAKLPENHEWSDPYLADVVRLRVGLRARVEQAIGRLDKNAGADTIALLTEIVRDYPDAPQARMALGGIQLHLGNLQPAVHELREAIRLQPDSVNSHMELGTAYYRQGAYESAAQSYRQAIALRPSNADVHFNLGLTLDLLGDRRGAIQALRDAVRYKPEFGPAHGKLGELLARDRNDADALVHLQHAVRLLGANESIGQTIKSVQERLGSSAAPRD